METRPRLPIVQKCETAKMANSAKKSKKVETAKTTMNAKTANLQKSLK